MDVRNSTLVAAAALCLAVIMAFVTLSGLWYYGTPEPAVAKVRAGLPTRSARMPDRSNVVAQLADARSRAAEMEARLSDAQQELADRTRALQRVEKKNEELKDEVTRSLNLALQFVGQSPLEDSPKTADPGEPAKVEVPDTPDAVAAELQRLRDQIEERDQEIALLELSADQETAELLANSSAFRSSVSQIVTRIGEPAVDAMLRALDHEQAVVRQWAAVVLGKIGPGASDAAPALREAATQDGSAQVREAARRALVLVAD